MKLGKSLKQYVGYFLSQTLVYNCNDYVTAIAFINELQVTHSYKHLVKQEVTKMRYIHTRAQKYIQIEDATRSSANCSPKQGVKWRNRRQHVPPKKTPSWVVGRIDKPAQYLIKVQGDKANFNLFKVSVDQVYSAIKDQEFIRRPRPLLFNPKGPGARKYCAFHDGMDHHTVNCRSLQRQPQELVNRGYLQEFVLNPGQASESKVRPSP